MTNTVTESNLSAIDAALAAAKSAKPRVAKPTPSAPRVVKTAEEKIQELKDLEAARAAKKAEREANKASKLAELNALRAAKKAERDAKKAAKAGAAGEKVPHVSKLEKAAAKLPTITEDEKVLVDEVAKLDPSRASALLAHIEHLIREVQTKASLGKPLAVGQVVKVTVGTPNVLGSVGTVVKVQRIRCLVEIPGHSKPAYCFLADVTPCEASELPSGDTEVEITDKEIAEAV